MHIKEAYKVGASALVLIFSPPALAGWLPSEHLTREQMRGLDECVRRAIPNVKEVYLLHDTPRASIADNRNQYVDLRTGQVVTHSGIAAIGIKGGGEVMSSAGFEALHPTMKVMVDRAVKCYLDAAAKGGPQ